MIKLLTLLLVLMPAYCMGANNADIVLGQVTSVSNPLVGNIGSELKSGYEAYFDELNEQGGIRGRRVRLVQKEDGFDAVRTLSLTRELIDAENVVALVGYLGTPGLEALVKENVLVGYGIALVGPSTGVARLLGERNVFPIRASYEAELTEIVAHAKAMQHRTVAFVTWNAGAGPILAKAFPSLAESGGLKLVHQAMFEPSRDAALLQHAIGDAIRPLQGVHADAVVVVAGGNALYEAIRHVRARLGAAVPVYTISSVNWMDLISNLGLKEAQGVVISQAVPFPYSPRLAIVKAYLDRMRRMGKDASYYSLEGYLGAAVMAEALHRASPGITRESVTAALNSMGRYQFGGFEVLYNQDRRLGFRKPETTLITSRGTLLR